jgi:hypothetical protein
VTATAKGADITATWQPAASGGEVTSFGVVLERRATDGTWVPATKDTVAADKRTWTTKAAAAGTYRVVVVATGPGGGAGPVATDPVVIS